jgi:hypothetical protein
MRYAIRGIVALTLISMGNAAWAHTDHAHVGKVWVSNSQSQSSGLIGKVMGGKYVTYLAGPIDCYPAVGFEKGCGQCYPNCYLGTPCTCCQHRVHRTIPGTKFGKLLKEQASAGLAMPIESPGLCARLRHETSFRPAM